MSKYSALIKRASNATAAVALTLASLTPAVMLGGSAKAAQLTSRKIDMTSSKTSASGVTYDISFTAPGSARYLLVEFCTNGPIVGTACTASDISFAAPAGGISESSGSKIEIDGGAAGSISGGETFSVTAVVNPTSTATFYARMVTYTADQTIATWSSETPGSYVDYGGVALSTTDEMSINARVQEQLTFCAGSVDETVVPFNDEVAPLDVDEIDTCGEINDTIVDLGVVGSGADSVSPVGTANTGNGKVGALLVSTNAISGVAVSYTSPNSLKASSVAENDCENDDFSYVDQCFNSQATPGIANLNTAFSGGQVGEAFGMKVAGIWDNGDTTNSLVTSSPYSNYAWNTTAETNVATSSSVVDTEVVELHFGARARATTPTGSYSTTANFVATATF